MRVVAIDDRAVTPDLLGDVIDQLADRSLPYRE
jgi:hypothetical protein